MKDINKIIDSLSPVEQNLMYNALQKKLNRGPEYTISYDKSGYYVKCDSPQLTAFRFEEEKYAELAYHIYNSVYGTGTPLSDIIKYTFRLLNIDSEWIQVNDNFSQAWKGCQKPMWFRILNIDRITNSIEVECHSFDGLNVFPEVWSLDSTEAGFEIGDYKLVK